MEECHFGTLFLKTSNCYEKIKFICQKSLAWLFLQSKTKEFQMLTVDLVEAGAS